MSAGADSHVSLAEVLQTSLKALEGTGLPAGIDQDSAENVAWLEARGLGGIAILARELERFGETVAWLPPDMDETRDGVVITSEDASAVLLAPGAVDFALGGAAVTIARCSAPLLIAAEAARRAPAGAGLTVSWGSGRNRSSARCGNGLAVLSLDIRTARQTSDVTIRAGKPPSAKEGQRLAGFHAHSLRDGILADAPAWKTVKEAAARVLVPASAQSRGGAGAEVDDSA